MASAVSLANMVDLALGTPELGAVNFNVLHALMHAVLNKLNIADTMASVDESDKEFLQRKAFRDDDVDSIARDSTFTNDSGIQEGDEAGRASAVSRKSRPGTVQTKTPYHALESKVNELDRQIQALNSLPSNSELFERSKAATGGDSETYRPLTDMWQNIQLTKRVDANEDGLSKMVSLVEDLMAEMQKIRESNEKLTKDLKEIKKDSSELDGLKYRFAMMETRMNTLDEQLQKLMNEKHMTPGDLQHLVTWEALENMLKGIRESLDGLTGDRVVVEASSQTDLASRPNSSKSRTSTPGPTKELMELLEQLGKLNERHDRLELRVEDLENKIDDKADKNILDGLNLNVPDDLLQQLKDLQQQMNNLQKSRNKSVASERSQLIIDSLKALTPKQSTVAVPTSKESEETKEDDAVSMNTFLELKEALENLAGTMQYDSEEVRREFMEAIRNATDQLDRELTERIDELEGKTVDLRTAFMNMEVVTSVTSTHTLEEPSPLLPFSPTTPAPEPTPVTPIATEVLEERPIVPVVAQSLAQKSSEFVAANEKLKLLNQDTSRQLQRIKKRLSEVDNELREMSDRIDTGLKAVRMLPPNEPSVDGDALTRLQQAILQIQAEVERLTTTAQQLTEDSATKQKLIEELLMICDKLDQTKADKMFVQQEVDVKADKRHLDNKVSRNLFDTTCDELNRMIGDILKKLTGHDDEWKNALAKVTSDLDGKLDRLEFGPIRDELDRQLRALAKKLASLDMSGMGVTEDEAAGLRKQLLQRFNCISCDRAIEVAPQGAIPSIPASAGLPSTRSTRPYTTFELEQIRQHARSMNQSMEVVDLYATQRPCGGSHTLTHPTKRTTRSMHVNNLFREEEIVMPFKEEMDIQGADGHIYKGRFENNKLPNISQSVTSKTPLTAAMSPAVHTRLPSAAAPMSAMSPRPPSGRRTDSVPLEAMEAQSPAAVNVVTEAWSKQDDLGATAAPTPIDDLGEVKGENSGSPE